MAGERIRIEVERSGGFGGITQKGSLDSAKLGAGESRDLADLLKRVDLGALAKGASGRAGVDRFQYHVTVERAGKRSELVLGETEVPAELKSLLDRLVSRR